MYMSNSYSRRRALCSNVDRKSTRLNSSHLVISYAVFCLKKISMLVAAFQQRLPLGVAVVLLAGVHDCVAKGCELRARPPRAAGHQRLPLGFFFFNDTATTEIYTLSLHDALPISLRRAVLLGSPTFSCLSPPAGNC